MEVLSDGVSPDQSGLTAQSVYVLDSTAGTITTGTYPYTSDVVVGYALSTTELLIKTLDFTRTL